MHRNEGRATNDSIQTNIASDEPLEHNAYIVWAMKDQGKIPSGLYKVIAFTSKQDWYSILFAIKNNNYRMSLKIMLHSIQGYPGPGNFNYGTTG
jgi:hypothetical protein